MRKWSVRAGISFVLLSCGGGGNGGSGHVEISGKPPSEGAALAARAVCTREARCGHVSITCMSGGSAGGSGSDASVPTMCTATIAPVAFDDCYADAGGDIEDLLECPVFTPADVDTLEICFDMLVARKCVTQAEADAQARAAEAGGQPTRDEPPPECEFLRRPPPGC